MAKEYFPFTGKIPFEGKDSKNVMAFHYYDPEKVVMGVAGMVPPAMRPMHRQMAKLAMDAIDNVPIEDRSFAGATMGISRDTYRRIACEAEKFRQKSSYS